MNKHKKNIEFELDAFEVSVCKDKEMQSFLNVFHFKEENLNKSHLGELFGVIKVFEYSQQNAYLPNLISQVLKKEFYSNSKNSAEEAFESSLKKANVALSDLTRHEVASWIGKLHAVIGVIQNDNFYFTQTGGGRILLIRDKKISDISRDLDNDNSDHPMKTFSDISSGKLFLGDKVLFCTESFFETFSWEDIKRHSNAFDSSEFDNLIKSTLELEADNVGISVTNVKEKIISPIASLPRTKIQNDSNFFGDQKSPKSKTLKKKSTQTEVASPEVKEEKENKQNKKQNKNLSPFEKQPELYIKEDDQIDIEPKKTDGMLDKIKGAIDKANLTGQPKKDTSKKSIEKDNDVKAEKSKRDTIKNKDIPNKSKKTTSSNEQVIKKGSIKIESKDALPSSPATLSSSSPTNNSKLFIKKSKSKPNAKSGDSHKVATQKNIIANNEKENINLSTQLEKRKEAKKEHDISTYFQNKSHTKNFISEEKPKKIVATSKLSHVKNKLTSFRSSRSERNYFERIKKIIFSYIKQYSAEFHKLKQKKRDSNLSFNDILRSPFIFSTIIIVVILFLLVTIFFKKDSKDYLKDTSIDEQPISQQAKEGVFIHDKEVEIKTLGKTDSNISALAGYNNDVYVFTENNTLYRYDSNVNEFGGLPASDQVRDVVSMVEMPVLNLIFFISNDSIYSYSPVLERFDQHKIKFPANLDLIGAGIHRSFSFLYVFDRNSGQVYRYPRTEGGFGSSINWFQQSISAENVVSFAIDDGIRVSYADGTIEQYYQKKLKDTFIIDTDPKVVPTKIKTSNEMSHYYILDKENPRILKISKNNNHVADQYWNIKFKEAKDFIVHEEKEAFVISKQNEILQLKLQ